MPTIAFSTCIRSTSRQISASVSADGCDGRQVHWSSRGPEELVLIGRAEQVDIAIDARLKQQQGYAIASTMRSLDFTGKVNDLLDEIGKHGIPIALPTWQSLHEQRDGTTTVRVKGQGLS